MKKISILLMCVYMLSTAFTIFLPATQSDAAERTKTALDDETRERMSAFISSFTEVEMFDISYFLYLGYEDYVYFGVMHNYLNNPGLVKKIAGGKVAAEYQPTFTAIKRYFGIDADTSDFRLSATYKGMRFECENESFIFDEPQPRKIWHASVVEAYKEDHLIHGLTLMKGFIHNKDDPSETRGSFWAWAQQPENSEGANKGIGEWSLLSIHEGEHDGEPFDAYESWAERRD